MNHILEKARQMGIEKLSADVSKTAEPFFESHGFYVLRRGFPIRRGVTLQNALMEKKLK